MPEDVNGLVVAKGLGRSFGTKTVLEGVDLVIAKREIVGVVGPNGGGKTTLLLLLGGLLRPTAGSVEIAGIPAHHVATARQGSVGLITAEHGVYPLLSGRENLLYFGGLFGLSPSEVTARAAPLVERLGLEADLDRRVAHYSSGMRQKLSLVRATFLDPLLLLLDEPTANLDPLSTRAMHQAVRDEARLGRAVVLVTHDLAAAEALCDRVLFVDGRVLRTEVHEGPRAAPAATHLHAIYESIVRR